jgi:hypothetical protein
VGIINKHIWKEIGKTLWRVSPFYVFITAWRTIVEGLYGEDVDRPRRERVRSFYDAERDMWFEGEYFIPEPLPPIEKKKEPKYKITPHKFE